MQQQIDDRLATELLAGEIHDGDTVLVDLAPGGEPLTVAPSAPAPAGFTDDWALSSPSAAHRRAAPPAPHRARRAASPAPHRQRRTARRRLRPPREPA